MSKAKLFARHARRQTDRAVSRVYRAFSSDPECAGVFRALLDAVRRRSDFLRRPELVDGRHLQIEALRNLAAEPSAHLRPIETWPGCRGSILCVVASLARHLTARYAVPKFLASAWFGDDRPVARARRRWYIAHSRGRRFRALDLPMAMTRRMEHLFLASPDHFSVPRAMRRAELHALGASPELVDAVLATRLGEHLSNGRFWRTVLHFFLRVSEELDPASVGPIVDFLQTVRHRSVETLTDAGPVLVPPPRPGFSMKGRTLASMLRLVERWHRSLSRSSGAGLEWRRSGWRPMVVADRPAEDGRPPVRWEFVELTSSAELRREGAILRHCVASYDHVCAGGRSHIWSLRRWSSLGKVRPVITIEVDPWRATVVQARGLRNRPATGRPMQLLEAWARRENLRLLI